MATWMGVDVGGRRKGFDAAVVTATSLVRLAGSLRVRDVVDLVEDVGPSIVGIDSPRTCAPTGERSRAGERDLARAVCGIRWTPDEQRVRSHAYYGWIVEGLALFDALSTVEVEVIEVFPTASWTRWDGRRVPPQGRAAWSRAALAKLRLGDVPARTNQDQRDAIAAAVTAREHAHGRTDTFDEIVVPQDG